MTKTASGVRQKLRRASLKLPESLVEAVPGRAGDRLRAVRKQQAVGTFLPPEGPSVTDNVGYNRHLWNWYADRWDDADFRQHVLETERSEAQSPADLDVLGAEWGNSQSVSEVVADWLLPYVGPDKVVGEIGTGGGRVARSVAPLAAEFHAFDVASRMLSRARRALEGVPNCHFHVVDDGSTLPDGLGGRFDFLYSFDVFVHLDLHTQWSYVRQISRVLKPGGHTFLHTANLATDAGWDRFAGQGRYFVEGFYFSVPELTKTLLSRAGLEIVREAGGTTGNFYYERDYLVVARKPEQ